MTTPDFTAIFNQVHGFISLNEAALLYKLASEVPSGGTIVEIGSYQGRSTVCLGLGAKDAHAEFYTIDGHEDYIVDGTHYGMHDHAALLKNLVDFNVADVTRIIDMQSYGAGYGYATDLLWIDGSHDYNDVKWDFDHYSRCVIAGGKVLLHDTAGYHPGVTQALSEILAEGRWVVSEKVDAITVLVRA